MCTRIHIYVNMHSMPRYKPHYTFLTHTQSLSQGGSARFRTPRPSGSPPPKSGGFVASAWRARAMVRSPRRPGRPAPPSWPRPGAWTSAAPWTSPSKPCGGATIAGGRPPPPRAPPTARSQRPARALAPTPRAPLRGGQGRQRLRRQARSALELHWVHLRAGGAAQLGTAGRGNGK